MAKYDPDTVPAGPAPSLRTYRAGGRCRRAWAGRRAGSRGVRRRHRLHPGARGLPASVPAAGPALRGFGDPPSVYPGGEYRAARAVGGEVEGGKDCQ